MRAGEWQVERAAAHSHRVGDGAASEKNRRSKMTWTSVEWVGSAEPEDEAYLLTLRALPLGGLLGG